MREQLFTDLETLVPIPLTREALERLNDEPGVYRLFLDDKSVYVGKADKSLRQRLQKHLRKLSGRRENSTFQQTSKTNLVGRIKFTCLYVIEDLNALAPEKMLIKTLKADGKASWNVNGFGNNDPGRNRDRSMVKNSHFDRLYPIDLSVMVKIPSEDGGSPITSLFDLMQRLKESLPFLFRFPTRASQETKSLQKEEVDLIGLQDQEKSAEEWFGELSRILPAGWLITVLPGYVICYREDNPNIYESRTGSWKTGLGKIDFSLHTPTFGASGEIEEIEEIEQEKV
nr:GIY-YIG nuclease family protein [Glutamicibacter soli]